MCESLKRVLVFEKGVVWISQCSRDRRGFMHLAGPLCPKTERVREVESSPYMLVNLSVNAAHSKSDSPV